MNTITTSSAAPSGRSTTALPSHLATWRDIVLVDEHHLDAAYAPDLSADWQDGWSVTYTSNRIETTRPVRTLAWQHIEGVEPIRTNSYHTNTRSSGGLTFTASLNEHLLHQSHFEHQVLLALDWSQPLAISSQFMRLDWRHGKLPRRHYPDLAVAFPDGVTVINVHHPALPQERHRGHSAALELVCRTRGWEFLVVSGLHPTRMKWVEYLHGARDAADRAGVVQDIADALRDGPRQWGDVVADTSAPALARGLLRRLCFERYVTVDINKPLSDVTEVALVEGDEL